ncbi:Expansin-A8 [Triticum urartu]|uniref:Expansin n=1 Tax=Triticum urartu TaxID=4572 RepID=M7ZCK5_TRIUA|nr:Expansin-A8 [Triticum urartu]
MSQPAWETIAVYQAGIVPVNYRRVPCQRSGGMRFTINGNDYFELVTVANVGGSGVVSQMWIKGSKTDWMVMSRNWGASWQSNAYLNGQSISFRVQTDDGRVITADNVAPYNWWNWGASWQSNAYLNGQSVSFRVQTDDNRVVTADNVAPSNWWTGVYPPGGEWKRYCGMKVPGPTLHVHAHETGSTD